MKIEVGEPNNHASFWGQNGQYLKFHSYFMINRAYNKIISIVLSNVLEPQFNLLKPSNSYGRRENH